MANNHGIPGKKMTSRFGISHRQARAMNREFWQPGGRKHYEMLSKRLAKRCKHPKMVDDSYGGPESGCMAAHCPRCGFSFDHTLY